MDKREEFLKLGYKKEVLKEILGIIENNMVSQPVEICLYKDGKLFDLTCDDASSDLTDMLMERGWRNLRKVQFLSVPKGRGFLA